jgi:proteasomal ATPase-associated factor 1
MCDIAYFSLASSSMSSNILNLPIVTIQDSFSTVISEVESGLVPLDKFWVSCYLRSQTSVHAEVHVELDEKDRNLVRLQPNNANILLEKNRVS